MTETEEIVCKPTKWFLWRAVAMGLMFLVGALWFYRDYKWGYPAQNVERFHYIAFRKADEEYKKLSNEGLTAATWAETVADRKIFDPSIEPNPAEVLPPGTDLTKPWPTELTDFKAYTAAVEENAGQAIPPAWKIYSNSGGRKWSDDPSSEIYSKSTIDQQVYIAILCVALFVGALFFGLRTLGRDMRVDGTGYTPPGGKKIPFSAMKRIDARKWDTKGLAYIHYDDEGKAGKARIDGMVYGQFKKEEGEPAQKLYDRILANFKGELIELAREEDDAELVADAAPSAKNDSEG